MKSAEVIGRAFPMPVRADPGWALRHICAVLNQKSNSLAGSLKDRSHNADPDWTASTNIRPLPVLRLLRASSVLSAGWARDHWTQSAHLLHNIFLNHSCPFSADVGNARPAAHVSWRPDRRASLCPGWTRTQSFCNAPGHARLLALGPVNRP